jgi:hypothetical protein
LRYRHTVAEVAKTSDEGASLSLGDLGYELRPKQIWTSMVRSDNTWLRKSRLISTFSRGLKR